ncbi:MAG: B12-binding domain-containing radical SAM protein [Thermodesulfovibrionales bacterium]
MNVYLVAPCRQEDIWRKRRATFTLPPMALGIIACLTPPPFRVKVTDELVDDIDYLFPADLVGLSVNTTNALRAYEIAADFRRRGATVVMGGIHPSVLPEESLLHADCVVIGEAENVWAELLEDFAQRRLKRVYHASERPSADDIPTPAWRMLNSRKYFVPRTVQASRGCPHGCGFCSASSFFGQKYRFRPVSRVIDELRDYERKMVVFVDDNIAASPDYAGELFMALKPLRKMWVAQAGIEIGNNERLLRLAAESGCAGLLIGFESICYENRHDVRKLKKADYYAEAVRTIKGHGIGVHGSFVFGFDQDTPDLFQATLDFVLDNRLDVANYCTLTPYPGTRLFEEMESEGRLLHKNWALYDRYNLVFRPRLLSGERLAALTDELYRRTYCMSSIMRRVPWGARKLPYYFAINLSYRFGARERKRS